MRIMEMKNSWMLLLLFAACSPATETQDEVVVEPRTPVQVVSPVSGSIGNELIFLGTTAYLSRSVINASVAGFITKVNVKLGDRVKKGDVLFVLQTKEGRALQSSFSADSLMKNFGLIEMKAPASGVVSTLEKQQSGDYIMEGTPLCTIAESSQLVFQINVPFEFTEFAKQGKSCTIKLPNGMAYDAKFTKALSAMNAVSQTQTILASTNTEIFLPENMIVTAILRTDGSAKSQLFPRSCVLSDAMMTEFWVMQLLNDSLAVKIPVQIGQRTKDEVEVLSPTFSLDDRIISVGSYGLPDSAQVTIVETELK